MVSGNKQTSRTFLQMLALSIHYLELKSDCKQLFCDHMAAEFGAQRFYLCFVAFNTHTDTQTHAYTSLRFGVLDPGRQVALFGNTVCKLRGGGTNHSYAFRRTVALFFFFFCHVPELVGTFRWHCYPACFLRPAAFVSLSPIVSASFVPRLQQWLFFCLFIYMCTFCPCVFCLFCSAVCCVFLSSCCRAGK